MFELLGTDKSTKGRRGRLTTAHGAIETPAFMPVGTQGTVKAVSPRELRELKAQVILGNTYHLFVRPGIEVVRHFGGLHRFMNWDGPILTDSGGYQIFSLARLRKITEEGVHFQNHVDGTPAFISPEIAMEIQTALGSDIAMVLDECPPWPCEYDYAAKSGDMTARWAARCKNAVEAAVSPAKPTGAAGTAATTGRQLIFGIVQGATFADLRKQSAQALVATGFRRLCDRRGERGRTGRRNAARHRSERAFSAGQQTALRHGAGHATPDVGNGGPRDRSV